MDIPLQTTPGWIITIGSLSLFIATLLLTLKESVFLLTEVILSVISFFIGVYVLHKAAQNIEMQDSEEEEEEKDGRISEEELSRSSSPFYFELEPIVQRRELPPIPGDISRTYDPAVRDKV